MHRPFTSGSRQAPDPFDKFLEDHALFRKHTARDSSCLFRVLSEQKYDTQMYHDLIRKKCVEYMRNNRSIFKSQVNTDFDEYLDDMSKPKTYGTLIELQAVSYMFRWNVILYEKFNLGNYYINNSKFTGVFRVFYTPEKHFDSVFLCDYIRDVAICQAICYEILYRDLFKLPDVSYAVEQMLHSASPDAPRAYGQYNEDGYCTGVELTDGRFFKFDLPQNTCCILENNKLCHFHYTNFPFFSDEIRRDLSKSSKVDESGYRSLNKTMESLLPEKYVSCVRQLLVEGITPFPYKVAKALDPTMYRNIEFDAWNDLRKELKVQSWYTGDSDFKVGAKCNVRLHTTEPEMYTCHIQEISIDKGYCVVFVEQLGEKRLVPYESLIPLPADEFKPWSLPYRVQRQLQQKHGALHFTRQYNYRLKFNEELYDNYDEKKQYDYKLQHYSNDCYFKLKQYTHLENFETKTLEFCTMPATIEYGGKKMTGNKSQSNTVNGNSDGGRGPEQFDNQSQRQPQTIIENSVALEQAIEPQDIDQQQDIEYLSNEEQYMYAPFPLYEDCYSYSYDNTLMQPSSCMVPPNATPYFYTYQPQPSNIYVHSSSSVMQQVSPGVAPQIFAAGSNQQISYYSQPFYSSAPIPIAGPPTAPVAVASSSTNQAMSTRRGITTSSSINREVNKSYEPNGSDLPSDISTLRYFFNLGVDYHKLKKTRNDNETDSKEAIKSFQNIKLEDNVTNIKVEPPTTTASNNGNKKRFTTRSFINNRDRPNHHRGGHHRQASGHYQNKSNRSTGGSSNNTGAKPEQGVQTSPTNYNERENSNVENFQHESSLAYSEGSLYGQEQGGEQGGNIPMGPSPMYMPMPIQGPPYGIYPAPLPSQLHPAPPTGYTYIAPPANCVPMPTSMQVPPPVLVPPDTGFTSSSPVDNNTIDANQNGTMINSSKSPPYSRIAYPPPYQIMYPSGTGIIRPSVSGPQGGYWCLPPVQTMQSPQATANPNGGAVSPTTIDRRNKPKTDK